jgi:hypothetical protein
LQVVEPLFLLVVHAIDAEIDGLGVEGGGVDAEARVERKRLLTPFRSRSLGAYVAFTVEE